MNQQKDPFTVLNVSLVLLLPFIASLTGKYLCKNEILNAFLNKIMVFSSFGTSCNATEPCDAVIGPLLSNNRIKQMHRCVNVLLPSVTLHGYVHKAEITPMLKGLLWPAEQLCRGNSKSLVCVSRKQFEWHRGGNFLLIT